MTIGAASGGPPAGGPAVAGILPGRGLLRDPLVRFVLGPADRPLVEAGARLVVGDPLLERVRDVELHEQRWRGIGERPAPGTPIERDQPLGGVGARAVRFDGAGRVLYTTPRGQLRAAVGRNAVAVLAPAGGFVERVDGAAIELRTAGLALPGAVAAGEASRGRLVLAVEAPDAELPAAAINVHAVGTILVAGARTDVEALSRARAIGVRGVIVGGLVSRDLRGFIASERRQRSALHGAAPFGLLVLDGYGRRPISGPAWAALRAAAGTEVALFIDPPLLLLGIVVAPPAPAADRVRVTSGELLGREGRLLGFAGRRRLAAAVRLPMGRVALDPLVPGRPEEQRLVPLADLERLT